MKKKSRTNKSNYYKNPTVEVRALVVAINVAAMFLCVVLDGSCPAVLSFAQGYFLLRFLASQVGEQQFIDFFRLFVKKYHGQLILSQVRL